MVLEGDLGSLEIEVLVSVLHKGLLLEDAKVEAVVDDLVLVNHTNLHSVTITIRKVAIVVQAVVKGIRDVFEKRTDVKQDFVEETMRIELVIVDFAIMQLETQEV